MENTVLLVLSLNTALRRQMDVIAHNIANVNTTAYKEERVLFETYMQEIDGQELAFVKDFAVAIDLSEGPITATGNALDVAIRGDAFFQVDTPDGIRFTRAGHFELDADGALVTSDGHLVLGDDGFPILTIPGDTEIRIDSKGTVTSETGEIGRLGLVFFEDPGTLVKQGAGLYATEATPLPATDAKVVQGSLEGSNVQPIVEMTRMISLLRAYQAAQTFADRQDELRNQAISSLANVSQNV
ncbi:MAG: flagellar basal-body rod protein FlgF [Proteobacteria bacterium]|nr:flagellar basal-body rod protein FlgF [Pseudomonadota bacterium]